jgi:hypothetical protein
MPLLDHFHPPVHPYHGWESFRSNWATRIADLLNERWLPPEFLAEEYTRSSARTEIDVATYEQAPPAAGTNGPAATLPRTWTPPVAARSVPTIFPGDWEVQIITTTGGARIVAAIELISPANKDRPEERQAFAIKCARYLHSGVSLVIIDVVTSRRANLHTEILSLMKAPLGPDLPDDADLYAVSYRPVLRSERPEVDLWPTVCAVGQPLPTMPLHVAGDLFVPVEFEASYQEACRRRRLA